MPLGAKNSKKSKSLEVQKHQSPKANSLVESNAVSEVKEITFPKVFCPVSAKSVLLFKFLNLRTIPNIQKSSRLVQRTLEYLHPDLQPLRFCPFASYQVTAPQLQIHPRVHCVWTWSWTLLTFPLCQLAPCQPPSVEGALQEAEAARRVRMASFPRGSAIRWNASGDHLQWVQHHPRGNFLVSAMGTPWDVPTGNFPWRWLLPLGLPVRSPCEFCQSSRGQVSAYSFGLQQLSKLLCVQSFWKYYL